MKTSTATSLLALFGSASAAATPFPFDRRSILGREVPQEHSHNIFLDIVRTSLATNNPLGIQDPVFGLLGNAAAAKGVTSTVNLDCLKQLTADQAFTNAKAAGDVRGMAGALMYQAIERNTAGVGVKSAACNETATNPEIAAIQPHQDPASSGAAATNKAITLALAKQLALIGVDPQLALESGTFAAGSTSDSTGKGNSCDTESDEPGCIFSQRLLVLDATPDEISSAVATVTATFTGTGVISATDISFAGLSIAGGGVNTANAAANVAATATTTSSGAVATDDSTSLPASCSVVTTTVAAGAAATLPATTTIGSSSASSTDSAAAEEDAAAAADAATTTAATTTTSSDSTGTNIQSFTGTLGGTPPPVISSTGDRPFSVNGNTFTGASAALGRSCDIQHNACARAANSGTISGGTSQCDTQDTACRATITRRSTRRALKPIPAEAKIVSVAQRATSTSGQFGSCTNPSVSFGIFDGRTENSFEPANQSDFGHGSALKIGIIAGFICQRLSDSCKADATVVSTCAQASSSAVAATQDQTAADVFNSILLGSSGSGSAVTATTTASSAATQAADSAAASVTTTIVVCSA